jgi:hypothetical protein
MLDRFLAAILSPLFFNVSLLIVATCMSRRGRLFGSLMYLYTSPGLGMMLFVALPAAVGFIAGTSGTAKLLGHAFWTHVESERSIAATVIVWGLFAVCFYVALGALPE